MARKYERTARFVVNNNFTQCRDFDGAVRALKALASDEGSMWSLSARRLVAGGVIQFMREQQEYVEQVEFGCKQLLLQAAQRVGERDAVSAD